MRCRRRLPGTHRPAPSIEPADTDGFCASDPRHLLPSSQGYGTREILPNRFDSGQLTTFFAVVRFAIFTGPGEQKARGCRLNRCPGWLRPMRRLDRRTRLATASVTPSWRRWRVCRCPASPGRPRSVGAILPVGGCYHAACEHSGTGRRCDRERRRAVRRPAAVAHWSAFQGGGETAIRRRPCHGGVPSRHVLELADASSGDMRLSDHAARSMI